MPSVIVHFSNFYNFLQLSQNAVSFMFSNANLSFVFKRFTVHLLEGCNVLTTLLSGFSPLTLDTEFCALTNLELFLMLEHLTFLKKNKENWRTKNTTIVQIPHIARMPHWGHNKFFTVNFKLEMYVIKFLKQMSRQSTLTLNEISRFSPPQTSMPSS